VPEVKIFVKAKDEASKIFRGIGTSLGDMSLKGQMALTAVAAGTTAFIAKATLAAARIDEMNMVLDLLGDKAGYTSDEMEKYVESIKQAGIRTDVAQTLVAQFTRYNLDLADSIKLARVVCFPSIYWLRVSLKYRLRG